MAKKLPPVHPGEVLREEFLRPMNLSAYTVARAVGVPRTRIERLANEHTAVTADTALRLARYFGTTPSFWMGMQAQYDLAQGRNWPEPRAALSWPFSTTTRPRLTTVIGQPLICRPS
jgi:addiction module HigA family antidote